MQEKYLYFGGLGLKEKQYEIDKFIGLTPFPKHDREIRHDAVEALPFADDSIAKIQSQDVFEHLPYEKIPFVLDEIYRVLRPSGIFRLSVPDYRSPLLKKRSIFDFNGKVIGDLMMGATAFYDSRSASSSVKFKENGGAHLWFPRYDLILELIILSNIRKCNKIIFYQYFFDENNFVAHPIPEDEMRVKRCVPHDMRANGAPISIVVDFVK